MRKSNEVYWTTSLPRDHEALQTLDAYCKEWGGLSRAEATRRLLIEWDKLRRGQPPTAWIANVSSQSGESVALQRASQTTAAVSKPSLVNRSARAASQVLDE